MSPSTTKRTRDSPKHALLDNCVKTNESVGVDSKRQCVNPNDSNFKGLSDELTKAIRESISNEMKTCEEKIVSEINTQICAIEKRLLEEIKDHIDSLRFDITSINERVSSVEAQCSEIGNLRQEIFQLKSDMADMKYKLNKQENASVASELRISGIPKIEKEDLMLVFQSVCTAVNIKPPVIAEEGRCRCKVRLSYKT